MSNVANNGTLIGRLASDPKAFQNADGSHKVFITLYVDRPYKDNQDNTVSDAISTEAFVSNKADGLGPYNNVHAGDLVAVETHIEQQPYQDKKTNKTVYPQPRIVADRIKFLEPRSVTTARMAKRSATQAVQNQNSNAGAQAAEAPQAQQAQMATAGAPSQESSVDYSNNDPFGSN